MKQVFADTNYWVALINPRDPLNVKAKSVSDGLGQVIIVTSEMVLTEFANFFAKQINFRQTVFKVIDNIQKNPNTKLIHQTSRQFQSGLTMYYNHADKEWSLTDCVSIQIMRDEGVNEVLAFDEHFVQAGFKVLLRE